MRRHVPRLEDVTTWAPDMLALLDLVDHGELARAVAAEARSPDFSTPPTR